MKVKIVFKDGESLELSGVASYGLPTYARDAALSDVTLECDTPKFRCKAADVKYIVQLPD